jgi:subtilase family serine protease
MIGWQSPCIFLQLAGFSTPKGYSPTQIRTAYGLPSSGGTGIIMAIIDAYDTPTIWDDLSAFSMKYSLPLPTSNNFIVKKMDQNMELNSSWAQETCLDVEWAHAIAPNATILLVEAKNSSSTYLYGAVDYATKQAGVVAVSMSWGGPEFVAETTLRDPYFNKPGIAFFASSGDDGS